jgi:integrase/recombinase XerD
MPNKDTRFNPRNERMKYKYRIHLKRIGRKDEKTIVEELKHLRGYEIYTGFDDFAAYNDEVADKYINYLLRDGFSLSYISDNLRVLRAFLNWLRNQRGYKSKINYNHIEYLGLTNNQRKTAKAPEYKKAYKYQQILSVIRTMPSRTLVEQRNKAIISLQALCGMRVSELRTIKIKNIIEEDSFHFVYANPKDMQIKYAKLRQANFLPLPDDIKANVLAWRNYLIEQGFKDASPLFPQIPAKFNQHNLLEIHLTMNEIKSGTTIRNIFKRAFGNAGITYINPHSFRHTLARFAEKQSPGFLNAVRQSLGHSSIDTTLDSYGRLSTQEQTRRFNETKFEF